MTQTMAFTPLLASHRQKRISNTRLASAVLSKKAPPTTSKPEQLSSDLPLLEAKMGKIKLPMMAVGKESVIIPVKVNGQGPFNFMLDTGLTAQMISPRLKKMIHSKTDPSSTAEGLAAGGSTGKVDLVNLSGVSLCGFQPRIQHEEELDLPSALNAVVTNFAQESLDKRHPVAGMLGMEMLEQFDVDLDFPAGVVRFWAPGTAKKEARHQGMSEIPIAVINKSLLLATRISGKTASTKKEGTEQQKQPFLGILDSGSTFSAINWKAAEILGLPPEKSPTYLIPPAIMAVGVDNKPLYIPTKKVEFTFCGEAISNEKGVVVGFVPPPPQWKPWKPVLTGIGDLPMFELVLGSDKKPFEGPAVLIGMDVLSQRRVILESCGIDEKTGKRTGRMFVSNS